MRFMGGGMVARAESIDPMRPSPELVKEVATLFRAGGVVAFPTDTIYGLGCSGLSPKGLARLREIKGAGRSSPFILLIAEIEWVWSLVKRVTPLAEYLMRRYWPGPLSIVLDASAEVPVEVTGGLGTVALRLPDCPLCLSVCRELGGPVASTSANPSGDRPASDAAEISRTLGDRLDMLLDGGPPRESAPSTVVDARGRRPVVLRKGILRLGDDSPAAGGNGG